MGGRRPATIRLTQAEQEQLHGLLRCGSCTLAEQRRARIALLAAAGQSTKAIAQELGVSLNTVCRWRVRLARSGLGADARAALADAPRSGRPETIAPVTKLHVVAIACKPIQEQGLSGWTLDLLAEEVVGQGLPPVSRSSIHRILRSLALQPHRRQMWLHSPDPDFRRKVAEIVDLYLHPPPGSVVLSYDEKTGVQAVERKHPDRPARPGQLARHEFEYIRHGTQSLLATLNVHSGEVISDCGPTRKAEDMTQHMERVAARYASGEVHVVLDNLNIHHGERWEQFNERHGGRFH